MVTNHLDISFNATNLGDTSMKTLLRQRAHSVILTALLLFILMIITTLSTAAFAAVGGGGTNTTTYTTSTKTVTDTSYSAVTQQVNTFSVELIASMQGGQALYDQTFNVAFSDAAVQAAILTAQGVLTTNGAASFLGPTFLSGSTSLLSSVSQTGAPVTTGIDISAATSTYIGPQTIWVGDNQSQSFAIVPGGIDYDTLVTSLIHQTITTTTTDTYLTSDVYQLVGVPAPVPVPAPILLLGSGLLGLAGIRKKFKK
jgi:hypothetical protein